MINNRDKCYSLKKQCLLLIGIDDRFSAECLNGAPQELLDQLKQYCSPTQLLKFDGVFSSHDVDTSWEWRHFLVERFGGQLLWGREIHAPWRYRPFIVGEDFFSLKQIFCSLITANLMKDNVFNRKTNIDYKETSRVLTEMRPWLPHVSSLTLTPNDLIHVSKILPSLRLTNLKLHVPATSHFTPDTLINAVSMATLRSLSIDYMGTPSLNTDDTFRKLVELLEVVYASSSTQASTKSVEDSSANIIHVLDVVAFDEVNEQQDISSVTSFGTSESLKSISKVDCDLSVIASVRNSASVLNKSDSHDGEMSHYDINLIYEEEKTQSKNNIEEFCLKRKDKEEENCDIEDIDLYAEALYDGDEDRMDHASNMLPKYVTDIIRDICEAERPGDVLEPVGLESLKVVCLEPSEVNWNRFCQLLDTWSSLRRLAIDVRSCDGQRHDPCFPKMLIQKVGYGYLSHVRISGTSNTVIEAIQSLLVLFFKLFRINGNSMSRPALEYLGLKDIDRPQLDVGICNLSQLFPYQIHAVKQVDLESICLPKGLMGNLNHFLACNDALCHLDYSMDHPLEEDSETGEPLALQLSQWNLTDKSWLDTIILRDYRLPGSRELGHILIDAPHLKRLFLYSCKVGRQIDDTFLKALSQHKHLLEVEIEDDDLGSVPGLLDVLFDRALCHQLRSLRLVLCKLRGSTILASVQRACDRLPRHYSLLMNYINLSYNLVNSIQLECLKHMLRDRVKMLLVDYCLTDFAAENEFVAQM